MSNNSWNLLTLLIYSFLIFIGSIFVYYFLELRKQVKLKEPIVYWCGNPDSGPLFEKGNKLFKSKCAACHNINMRADMTGPALFRVKERWSKYPKKDLYDFIKNSQGLIKAQHPKAVEIWTKWNKSPMPTFPDLTDKDIDAIMDYINAK